MVIFWRILAIGARDKPNHIRQTLQNDYELKAGIGSFLMDIRPHFP